MVNSGSDMTNINASKTHSCKSTKHRAFNRHDSCLLLDKRISCFYCSRNNWIRLVKQPSYPRRPSLFT